MQSFDFDSSLFLSLAALGLAMAIIVEHVQLLAKYNGARAGKVAKGYTMAMKILLLNRIGTVLYFLFIAIAVDMGNTSATITYYFIYALVAVAVANILVTLWFLKGKGLYGSLFRLKDISFLALLAAFIAPLFGLLGLTIPILLSADNPEFRLTLANTGFLFNSIFSLINIFFVESYIAKLIDENNEKLSRFVALVFIARVLSASTVVIILLFLVDTSFKF